MHISEGIKDIWKPLNKKQFKLNYMYQKEESQLKQSYAKDAELVKNTELGRIFDSIKYQNELQEDIIGSIKSRLVNIHDLEAKNLMPKNGVTSENRPNIDLIESFNEQIGIMERNSGKLSDILSHMKEIY